MNAEVSAPHAKPDLGASRMVLFSRGVGALVFVLFGAMWALFPTFLLAMPYRLFLLVVIAIVAVTLLTATFRYMSRVRQHAFAESSPQAQAHARSIGRQFALVNVIQYVLIFACSAFATNLGHPEWVVPVIALVVGLHFFPLARMFHTREDYVIGGILCALAVVGFALGTIRVGPQQVLLSALLVGFGAAPVLWAGALVRLLGGLRALRAIE